MTKYLKFDTPASKQADELRSDFDLKNHGFIELGKTYWNLPAPALYEEAIFRGEANFVHGGPLLVNTGKWSARAPQDKFVVKENTTGDKVWWGTYNRPFASEKFDMLFERVQAYMQGKELFVQDCFAGADPEYRMPVRIITDTAWQSLFARNMFITERDREALKNHIPEFTIIAATGMKADPRIDGTRSDTAILLNFEKRMAVICNTCYGGEIKKTIFTVMNYLLPERNVLSMHCSANVGKNGDVALFFGLSGTGKTTLSADPRRQLIGDDEHGWCDNGVFNVEGGCYAKVIRLSSVHEPQIYECTHRFGTILENVVFNPVTRRLDLNDDSNTENTRAAYPLEFIPNTVENGYVQTHPKNVIFLTCDAQGVLPPIARLNPDQAMYHFMSGYTSKIAGTEMGLGIEPEITFSTCFGGPFMVHHPFKYAEMLKAKVLKHGAQCWLVNTGWVGGKFGVGNRISISHTRNLLNAVLDGHLDKVKYSKDRIFGFEIPTTCPDVPEDVLTPEAAWSDKDEYWKKYDALAARYVDNFKAFEAGCPKEVLDAGPKRLS